MTFRQILARLRKDGKKWKVHSDGAIRSGCMCPISSLRNEIAVYYGSVSIILNIEPVLRMDVVEAADSSFKNLEGASMRKIRSRRRSILRACRIPKGEWK